MRGCLKMGEVSPGMLQNPISSGSRNDQNLKNYEQWTDKKSIFFQKVIFYIDLGRFTCQSENEMLALL